MGASILQNKTKERALEIISIYLKAVENVKSVKSVILVGSLSDDTYTGNAGSDIDLVHIIYDHYDFDLSIDNKDLIERPIEIFRILDSGKLLYGADILSTLERPTQDDVQKSIELEQQQLQLLAKENPEWFSAYTEMRKHPTIRIMTQIVLTTALSDYYFHTGRSCSSKYQILELAEKDMPDLPYINLLRLCHKNRFSPNKITEEDINTMNREYKYVFLKD